MRHAALCYDAMRSDTMIINSIVLIVEHFLTVKTFSTINKITTTKLKI